MLHTKFQAAEPSSSEEEDFSIFFMYFYDSKIGTPGPGPSRFLRPLFGQLGKKDHQAMPHTKVEASESYGSEEEDLNIFCVFVWFETRTPWHRAILDAETFV